MDQRNSWLILSLAKDDLRVIQVDDSIWGNISMIDRLCTAENDIIELFPEGLPKSYCVIKQGFGALEKEYEETKTRVFGRSVQSTSEKTQSQNSKEGPSNNCEAGPSDRNEHCEASTTIDDNLNVECCQVHKDIAKRCLNIEKQVHEMSEVLESFVTESNNKIMKMKLHLNGVVSRAVKLFDPTEDKDEEIEQLDNDMEIEDAELLCEVEAEPPIQYGEGGRNLDTIYIGHQPLKYGLALRTWVFGKDGLSKEMIMPQRQSTRVRAPREKVLTFLRSVQRKFPRARYPNARKEAVNAANKAGLNARARISQTGQYSQQCKDKKKDLRRNKRQEKQRGASSNN